MSQFSEESAMPTSSIFSEVKELPANIVLGLNAECVADMFPDKINLTIGAYRDETGNPVVLRSVREAETFIYQSKMDNEYLPQDGDPSFTHQAKLLLFGEEHKVIQEHRAHTIQGISGTGSLYIGFNFLKKNFPGVKCIIPNISWENHKTILEELGISYSTYRYADSTGLHLDFNGFLDDVRRADEGTVVLFHMCAHNPTGIDPSDEQWGELLQVVKDRKHIPFFDAAYQGFVTGNVDTDAYSARMFADAGCEMLVAQSFSKNFGLYGHRAGALHVVSRNGAYIPAVASQLRVVARALYSTCPAHGARIVAAVLSNPERKALWKSECLVMATRLSATRAALLEELIEQNVKGDWSHLSTQKGMFSFSGINPVTVKRLKDEYHVYLIGNGRISLAGLNTANVSIFVAALKNILGENDNFYNVLGIAGTTSIEEED